MTNMVDELVEAIESNTPQNRSLLSEFLDHVSTRTIPNDEVIRWLKAVHANSISAADTAFLTKKMMDSGTVLSWNSGIIVDKHSTGGVGDKMSLILAPLLACMGLSVPMLAGRGLGHTGGTIDKLESIQGFRTNLSGEEIKKAVENVGCCITAQSSEIAPADSLLYALRDISETIDSIPLITASIISKKAAEGLGCLVLDVKCGDAAFTKNVEDAEELSLSMQNVAEMLGIKCVAQITHMDNPIGDYIGNALEVIESILIMKGYSESLWIENGYNREPDSLNIVLMQACELAKLAGKYISENETYPWMLRLINDGSVLNKFIEMCVNQGVDKKYMLELVEDPSILLGENYVDVLSAKSGFVEEIDSLKLAKIARKHRAGRFEFGEQINHSTGFIIQKPPTAEVKEGDTLARFYFDYSPNEAEINEISDCFKMCPNKPTSKSRLIKRVGARNEIDFWQIG